ncbi:hypothetical protein, partial [Bacteroides stercoris]|uniref:hypothetical protein n=1 Tax=Bacteroides stercoris TaxID=46506 RepID=UPI001C6FFAEE
KTYQPDISAEPKIHTVMERRVASDILLNAFHERYSPFEKCAVKFSTVARIVRAESVAGKIYCESIIVKRIW